MKLLLQVVAAWEEKEGAGMNAAWMDVSTSCVVECRGNEQAKPKTENIYIGVTFTQSIFSLQIAIYIFGRMNKANHIT